jgi:hypothetical protein
MVNGTFWKISKKIHHISRIFFFEIAKIFGGFGQVSRFLFQNGHI